MNDAFAKVLKGEAVVVVDRTMGDRVQVEGGKVYAGSVSAFEREMAVVLAADWVALRTVPPTLMHRQTGELIDVPETPSTVPGRCGICGVRHA